MTHTCTQLRSRLVHLGMSIAVLLALAGTTSYAQTGTLTATVSSPGSVSTSVSVSASTGGKMMRGTSAWSWCSYDTLPQLRRGSRSDHVRDMQAFLQSQGLLTDAQVTGYFGPATATAVAKLQTQETIARVGGAGYGMVGPKTWNFLKRHCDNNPVPPQQTGDLRASSTSGGAPLTVTFYTNYSAFRTPTVWYELDYGDGSASERTAHCYAPADWCQRPGENTHTYTANGTYTATLYKVTDPCPASIPGTPRCMAAVQRQAMGTVQIRVGSVACTMEYNPVCGAKPVVCIKAPCNPVPTTYGNKCAMQADGATLLYQGQCKSAVTTDPANDPQCKTWFDGCNSCARSTPGGPGACTLMACLGDTHPAPYCKTYFTEPMSGGTPVISGFSGPTVLTLGQTGTWRMDARDPDNGTLSYAITWGDEDAYGMASSLSMQMRAVTQSSSFTHVYARTGIYTVTLTVTDDTGKQARATSTVVVR